MRLPYTLNIQTGRKLNDKSKEEIMEEVVKVFDSLDVVAVQVAFEVVRVTFKSDDCFRTAMANSGVRLFGLWCPILGGGPPVTLVHVFDYPFEGIRCWVTFFSDFDEVKNIKKQTYLSNQEIYTSTRLVSVVLKGTPSFYKCHGFPPLPGASGARDAAAADSASEPQRMDGVGDAEESAQVESEAPPSQSILANCSNVQPGGDKAVSLTKGENGNCREEIRSVNASLESLGSDFSQDAQRVCDSQSDVDESSQIHCAEGASAPVETPQSINHHSPFVPVFRRYVAQAPDLSHPGSPKHIQWITPLSRQDPSCYPKLFAFWKVSNSPLPLWTNANV